jgi:hypothetical protein
MTAQDLLWRDRFEALTRSSYRLWVHPPGGRIRVPPFVVYAWLMRSHRWLWVRGLRL